MTTHLIQRLRTCTTEERRAVAMELVKEGTDEAIEELIRMFEGKRRIWFRFYDFKDQLIAADAIGQTKRRDLLDYLRNSLKPKESVSVDGPHYYMFGSDLDYDSCFYRSYHRASFPNLRGKLKKILKDKWVEEDRGLEEHYVHPRYHRVILRFMGQSSSDKKRKAILSITSAIEKLETITSAPYNK